MKISTFQNRQITEDEIKRMDEQGQLARNLNRSIEVDTLAVPSGGYAILRFVADNPGFNL